MSEILPSGVKHLHGSLYLVKFDLLKIADPEPNEKKYEFKNPRTLTQKGQSDLFDKIESAKLRTSIKSKSLMMPFICRWKKEVETYVIQLVGGERRYRALAYLINKKEMVRDHRSPDEETEFTSADIVYHEVLCQIYSVENDIEALSLSYTENDCRLDQGHGTDIAMVVQLRECKATDAEILATLSKDDKWLKETTKLMVELPENVLQDLIEDRIERSAALEFISIKDTHGLEVAEKSLEAAHDSTQKLFDKKKKKIDVKLNELSEREEIAEGELADAKLSGDVESASKAEADLESVKSKVKRVSSKRTSLKKSTGKQQIRNSFRSISGTGARSTILRSAKIQDAYIDKINQIIDVEKFDDSILTPEKIMALRLSCGLISEILKGNTNCEEIIKKYFA